ncbi:MAG TPA: hypothetical protein VMM37_06450 [Bacteroidota bacterium]|nr:hypothetical protein [Bacteroidota bacterium]
MKRKTISLLFFCVLMTSFGFGRQARSSTTVVTVSPSISVGARFSFYGPKLDNLNTAFGALEDTIGLGRAPDFKVFSLGSANIRYNFAASHSIGVEAGMSYWKSKLGSSESIERVYTIGAEYYYSFQNRRKDYFGLDAGAGGAFLVANFERNYDTQRISVLKKTFTANASLLGWVSPFDPLSIEVEARYMFVPSFTVNYPNATVKMSSVVVGAGISILF